MKWQPHGGIGRFGCVVMLLLAGVSGALGQTNINTGTTGVAWVFANGVMDWNTFQFKPLVQVTLNHLGQYDTNGNWVASNHGLLTGKYCKTSIESLNQFDSYDFGYLSNVPDFYSSSNDFRVDYTGATDNDPRDAIVHSSEAMAYYWIDDYRTRFLNDAFIDSLDLPTNLANNLKNLQYRPDLQMTLSGTNWPNTLAKFNLRILEELAPDADLIFPPPNLVRFPVRTRASVSYGGISDYQSLPPLSFAFDAGTDVGEYVGLIQNWVVGFNTGFPSSAGYGETSGWQNDVLAPLNDGVSYWASYRYTGQTEVDQYLFYALRKANGENGGGTFIPWNKGVNLRNCLMYDESETSAYGSGVFPYDGLPLGVTSYDGPIDSDRAGMFFAGLFWDIANDTGLGDYKTSQLVWKTLSLITNGTTFTMRDFGATMQQAARDLWPDPNHPGQSLYESELFNVMTARGIPLNGVASFTNNIPPAIGPTQHYSIAFSSGYMPAAQPIYEYGGFSGHIDAYTDPGSPAYVAYQFYRYSRFGPCDDLELSDGTFNSSNGGYNNDGTYWWSAKDRQLENLILLVPGDTISFLNLQRRAPDEAQGFYAEDVRPLGFRVIKAIPDGFSFTVQRLSETASNITYQFTVVDPSLTMIGPATYQWDFTNYLGNVTTLAGQSVVYTAFKEQPVTITLTRTRGGVSQSITLNDAGSNLDRENGQAFVKSFVSPVPETNAVLPVATAVTFSVDMNGAEAQIDPSAGLVQHPFDPTNGDTVWINGPFAGWNWWADWYGLGSGVPMPTQYQLHAAGGGIYTNTIVFPAGSPIRVFYKYGIGIGTNSDEGPEDDEAGFDEYHVRVIRSTGGGRYVMPQDTFGVQYQEPWFSGLASGAGGLQVGAETNGVVPVEWLGQPGLHLQTATNLAGPWVDDWATDGTNWTSGVETTNGLMSVTNWPVSATATFFRLVGE